MLDVILEDAPRFSVSYSSPSVSILIVLDVILEVPFLSYCPLTPAVSILIVLDVILEVSV